jgi:thiamine biosynthesis lipoprotein
MRLIFIIVILLNHLLFGQNLKKYEKVLLLMGSRFEIIAVSEDSLLASKSIHAAISEIQRIEDLISSWNPSSQTSLININAGKQPVAVNKELFDLIKRSIKVSYLTDGIFDISYASIDNVWKFDSSLTEMPDSSVISASVANINFRNIILDENKETVFLKNRDMKIGFGAIGKGYAANQARKIMIKHGIQNGVVNAGGDLISWGTQENGKSWSIAITDPKDKRKILGWLNSSNMAVVTSGNYEKYVEIDGRCYSHIINPKTGCPAFGIRSVTILCSDAELADALATATFILGEENGISLINKLKGVECLLVTEKDELFYSSGLELLYN